MEFPAVNPAIVAIVIGITQWLKQEAGLEGRYVAIAAFLIGGVLGAGYHLGQVGNPTGFADWFVLVIAGLIHALAPSGLYEVGKQFLQRR